VPSVHCSGVLMRPEVKQIADNLGVIPQAMAERKQWLLWRFVRKAGQDKPSKMPYYTNGQLRGWPLGQPPHKRGEKPVPTPDQPQVEQGHDLDRAHLVTLGQAMGALCSGHWDGLGFAFLPGDGLIGIDIDGAIDPDTGEVSQLCSDIIQACSSYTELSPSGKGVHIIVEGTTETFKCNKVGVEVFCGRQFFTVSARRMSEVAEVRPISPETLSWLYGIVKPDRAKKPAASASPGELGAASSVQVAKDGAMRYCLAALESAAQVMRNAGQGGRNDTLNSEAYGLARLVYTGCISVPTIRAVLGEAALAVGLSQAEVDGTLDSAIRAGLLEPKPIPESKLKGKPARAGARRPEPPAEGQPATPPEEPEWLAAAEPPMPAATSSEAPPSAKGGKGRKAAQDDGFDGEAEQLFWERVDMLSERFVFIETTDEAWDKVAFASWKVANMRLRWGRKVVNAWLGRVNADKARTVSLHDLVFEPGCDVPDHQINMFGGLDVEPIQCTPEEVQPMLDLLQHLCSETRPPAGWPVEPGQDEIDAVMRWVLCWQALPLQRIGTKMQTAIVLHGAQGTGKNLYWDMWRDLFGVYGITVGQTEIEDKYNGWVSRKLAIIGDEVVSRQEMYHNKNRLKSVVTQLEKFPIRGMHKETRWESNHANVVFLSNESQPLALEERDRRYLVIYTPLEAPPELYQRVRDFKANGGLGKWLYYLQHYPVGAFDAHTKPPMTQAKQDLIELNWKAPERFANEWLNHFLDLPVKVCSAEQLYRAFRRWCDRQGEKYPPPQAIFTTAVRRWARERVRRVDGILPAPLLDYRQICLSDASKTWRKTVRCWIPSDAEPEEGALGPWAYRCIEDFEDFLGKYTRGYAMAGETVS